jgi:hypothetical protein
MTWYYGEQEAKVLEEKREETAIKEGRPIETEAERERMWKLLTDAARN